MFLSRLRADTCAGDMKGWKLAVASHFPCLEGKGKRGDLAAAFINLQTVQIIAQHRIDGFGGRQTFLSHANRHKVVQSSNKKVAGPTAGIEHL